MFSTDVVKNSQEISDNTAFKLTLNDVENKFENLNIKSSYDDLNKLLAKPYKNDFYLLLIGDKAAELGFFDISATAFSKIRDIDISSKNIEEYKKFYYPKNIINKTDIIVLAELYSNIMYNDRIQETIAELNQYPRFLRDYDYANYIMAMGYFKLNDSVNAQNYINEAIKKNPININYKLLAAQITASDSKKEKYSKKYIKDVKHQNITTYSLNKKIKSAEEYIQYLSAKKKFEKDYFLGRYYFAENDCTKASKVLLSAISKNKKNNTLLYALLARCLYEQGDYVKSNEYTQKVIKDTKTNPDCSIALGDLKMKDGDFKSAVKYYKIAAGNKNLRQQALEKAALANSKIYGSERLKNTYKNIANEYNNSYISYYKIGLTNKQEETDYIKKALSLNFMFQDGWIDLARIMIEKDNLELAKNYLSAANYLDDKNFRYYYYQSLLNKKEKELNHAAYKK